MAGRWGQLGTDKPKGFQHSSNRNFQKLLHAPRPRYKVAGATQPGGLDQTRSQCGQPAPTSEQPPARAALQPQEPRPRAPRLLTSLPSDVHVEEDSRVTGVGRLSLGGWMRHCGLRTRVRPPRNTAWSPCSSNPKATRSAKNGATCELLPAGARRTRPTFRRRPSTSWGAARLPASLPLESAGAWARAAGSALCEPGFSSFLVHWSCRQLFLFLSLVFWESVVRLSPRSTSRLRSTSGLRSQAKGRLSENPFVCETGLEMLTSGVVRGWRRWASVPSWRRS